MYVCIYIYISICIDIYTILPVEASEEEVGVHNRVDGEVHGTVPYIYIYIYSYVFTYIYIYTYEYA